MLFKVCIFGQLEYHRYQFLMHLLSDKIHPFFINVEECKGKETVLQWKRKQSIFGTSVCQSYDSNEKKEMPLECKQHNFDWNCVNGLFCKIARFLY